GLALFFNQCFDDVRRSFCVLGEFHGVAGATLGHGTDVGSVTKHLAQRNFGTNNLAGNRIFHTLNQTTTTVQVTHHVTHVILGGHNFHFHDRLKHLAATLLGQLLGSHGGSNLERHLVRVDVVVGTIKHGSLQADQRITGNNAVFHL